MQLPNFLFLRFSVPCALQRCGESQANFRNSRENDTRILDGCVAKDEFSRS